MKHLLFLLLLSIPSITYTQTGTPPPTSNEAKVATLSEKVKGRLRGLMATGKFPGAQVGFVYVDRQTPDGKPRYVSGSVAIGVSDLQTGAPLKTTDRLLAASIGKTFVATLTMMLVQEGKLKLRNA